MVLAKYFRLFAAEKNHFTESERRAPVFINPNGGGFCALLGLFSAYFIIIVDTC